MANNSNEQQKKSSTSKKLKKKPSRVKRFLKYFFLTILIIVLLTGVVGVGYIYAVIKTAPPLDINAIYNLDETSMLYDDKGEFIDNLPSIQERYVVEDYDTLPKNLVNAYIAIEDERFMTHGGIDVKRILGAATRDALIILGLKDGGIHGASTITQQLVKNSILLEESSAESTPLDSINRKIKEIALSVQLDKELSKEEIMRAYLNTIPLGGYLYGVEAASKYYFGKSVDELNLLQCAYLAGITQAPSYYSAYNTEEEDYPNTYINRTKTVLDKMLELGYISQEEHDSTVAEADANNFAFSTTDTDYKLNQEWFVYPALDQVRTDLKEKYKYTDDEVDKLFVTGGLKIYTTMNTELQNKVQAVLDERSNLHVEQYNGEYIEEYSEEGVPLLQAAATVIDYRTGQVKVLIGGRGDTPPGSINNAYFDHKSIASTTKPLTVYGPAIDTKVMTAATPIDDTPISTELINKYGFNTNNPPQNYNGVMDGYITPRDAITYSKNLTSIKTVDKIGLNTAIEYGERAGLKYSDDSHTMSAASMGQFEQPIGDRDGGNTTILASAFGSFGNNGVRIEPILYTKVVDASGKVILEKEATPVVLFSPQTAYIMYNILKDPLVYFDANGAKFSDMPVSGKTGTTNNVDSFWFAGLTPYYSGSVWIGYQDQTPMGNGYSSSAADLFGSVMSVVHEGLEYKEIDEPSGIVKAVVCKDSGKLATNLCSQDQRGNRVKTELFIEGTDPKSYCDVHVAVQVNKENNKLVSDNTPKSLIETRVFIKKPNAYYGAKDYAYVVPTELDDTKAQTTINLSQIGLKANMDLYDAIVLLNDRKIKYTFNGQSVSGSLSPGQYILTGFTSEILEDGTVTLTISKSSSNDTSIGNNPSEDNNNSDENNNGNDDSNDNNDSNSSDNID